MSDTDIVGIKGGGFFHSGVKGIHSDGSFLSKQEVARVLRGEDAIGKAKVQYDFVPYDAAGNPVAPGDPRLASGYVDSFVEQDAADYPVDNFAQTGDESNTTNVRPDGTKDDDHGCTPVAHIKGSGPGRPRFRTRSHWVNKADGRQVGDDFFTPYITVA